jgi:hypothetical protein
MGHRANADVLMCPQRHLLLSFAGWRCFDRFSTWIRGDEEDDIASLSSQLSRARSTQAPSTQHSNVHIVLLCAPWPIPHRIHLFRLPFLTTRSSNKPIRNSAIRRYLAFVCPRYYLEEVFTLNSVVLTVTARPREIISVISDCS